MELTLRTAILDDVPALEAMISESVRGLQRANYTDDQIEGAIGTIYGTDKRMISDSTFFVVTDGVRIVGCGGWSKRRTAFGSDSSPVKDDSLLDPAADPAKIRGFFVHPDYARRGIATSILRACEEAALAAGFRSFELTSTLTGVPLYSRHGYTETSRVSFQLPNGIPYVAVRMMRHAGWQAAHS